MQCVKAQQFIPTITWKVYNDNDKSQVEEDEMGRACSMNGGEEDCI
jgi:hypothetical protein